MAPSDNVDSAPVVQEPPVPQSEALSSEIESSRVQKKPGPLVSLFERAASSPLVRKVDQKVPSEFRPALSSSVSHTRKVLGGLDGAVVAAKDALATDEGKELASASCAFAKSLIAFLRMLYASALQALENRAGLEKGDSDSLVHRSVRISRRVISRISTTMNKREGQVKGTCEAQMYSYVRFSMGFLVSLFAVLLNSLAGFRGPGSSFISPAAKQVIDSLPDDIHKSVTEEGDLAQRIEEFHRPSTADASTGSEHS
ncbi:unnamed protein product [Agarophyton chilense]